MDRGDSFPLPHRELVDAAWESCLAELSQIPDHVLVKTRGVGLGGGVGLSRQGPHVRRRVPMYSVQNW